MSLCLFLSLAVGARKWKMRTLERGTDAGPLFLYAGEGVVQISQTGIQCWCWCWCLHFQIFENFKPEMSVRRLLLWSPVCQCVWVYVCRFVCVWMWRLKCAFWVKHVRKTEQPQPKPHLHRWYQQVLATPLPLALTRHSRLINTALFSSLLLSLSLSWSFSLILRRFVNENDN